MKDNGKLPNFKELTGSEQDYWNKKLSPHGSKYDRRKLPREEQYKTEAELDKIYKRNQNKNN